MKNKNNLKDTFTKEGLVEAVKIIGSIILEFVKINIKNCIRAFWIVAALFAFAFIIDGFQNGFGKKDDDTLNETSIVNENYNTSEYNEKIDEEPVYTNNNTSNKKEINSDEDLIDELSIRAANFTIEFFQIMDSFDFNRFYSLRDRIEDELNAYHSDIAAVNTDLAFDMSIAYGDVLTDILYCINNDQIPSEEAMQSIIIDLLVIFDAYEELTGEVSHGFVIIDSNPLFNE